MTKPYTRALLRKFARLTEKTSSRDQMARISARLDLERFIKEHGKDTCDAMWTEIKAKDSRAAR